MAPLSLAAETVTFTGVVPSVSRTTALVVQLLGAVFACSHGDGLVRSPGRACPSGARERAGKKYALLASRTCAERLSAQSHSLREVLRLAPILLGIELRERMQVATGPILGSGGSVCVCGLARRLLRRRRKSVVCF
jgi:hypothetical protein